MSLLEHPLVAGLIVLFIGSLAPWIWRQFLRADIRLTATVEQGPTTRELGFAEPAIKITISNRSTKDIAIQDVRLMFCGAFGAPVAPEAPSGRTHTRVARSPKARHKGTLVHPRRAAFDPPSQPLSSPTRNRSRGQCEVASKVRDGNWRNICESHLEVLDRVPLRHRLTAALAAPDANASSGPSRRGAD